MQAAGAGAGGAGAAAGGAGAGAGPPVAGWINPDLLEEKCEDCECGLCLMVMVEPASGCPEGHGFCRSCLVKELRERKRCPSCRHPIVGERKLVRIRQLEGMIAKLRLRCEHWEKGLGEEAAGPPAAKRAKLAPAASMTVEALRKELRQRGLETAGNKPVLVARLEEDRKKGAGCGWRGCVGGLAEHLLQECEWAPVQCPHEGCTESPLRRDLAEHEARCEHRVVCCRYCETQLERQSVAEHEGRCQDAPVECPNEGCSVQCERRGMNLHRAVCRREEVTCPCPGCDARLLRRKVTEHMEATHLGSAVKLLKKMSRTIARLKERVAAADSEQRLAAASPTSWVFNWRADNGWEGGTFNSEDHEFREGVVGSCIIQCLSDVEHSHFIGFGMEGVDRCRVHATFSILDKHDKTLRHEMEEEDDCTDVFFVGRDFTPTAEDKAQSVRADGSIRLRAVVRLFFDDAA